MSGSPSAPAGWYANPGGAGHRWWDGHRWTEHVSAPGPTVWDQLEAERRWIRWGKWGIVCYGLAAVSGMLFFWIQSSHYRALFDTVRHDVRTHTALSPSTQFGVSPWVWLTYFPWILAYLGLMLWQFRAATTARWLGLPATHSPGLGVAGWIIPVVDLWFPYQALRDCLPPGDPGRRVVGRMWVCFVAAPIVNLAASVLLVVGWPAAPGLVAIALAIEAGFVVLAIRTVGAIFAVHRRMLFPAQPDQVVT
jgi:hypothetical protein